MKQLIVDPTRVTETSSTVIDLICTSDPDRVMQSGVLPCKMSDHNVIFCTRKLSRGQFNKHNVSQIRSMKDYDKGVLMAKLGALDWFEVINTENVNDAWNRFRKMFLGVVDSVAPLKTVRLKQRTESWFSGDILRLISERDKAWINFRKLNSSDSYSHYKMLRNKTQSVIKRAKRDFIKNEISENQNNPKRLWKTLKDLGMPTKVKGGSSNIGLKNDSDEISFDSQFVANKFNNFFCSVAAKLLDKLPKRTFDSEKIFHFYQNKGVKSDTFHFTVVSDEEVEKLLNNLNVSKSTGCDNIPANILKDAAENISSCTSCLYY